MIRTHGGIRTLRGSGRTVRWFARPLKRRNHGAAGWKRHEPVRDTKHEKRGDRPRGQDGRTVEHGKA